MFQFVMRQWKNRKATVLLMILGFFIGSLVMSLGTSASVESFEYIADHKRGDPDRQVNVSLSSLSEAKGKQKDMENIVERLGEYGEVQILSMGGRKVDHYPDKMVIVPVLFNQEPDWHIPLTDGRYFLKKDMQEKSIIVGKSIAEKNGLKTGDQLAIEGEKFRVIGIGGRSNRETAWEHAIYMPWKAYVGIYEDWLSEKGTGSSLSIHLESGKNQFLKDSSMLIKEANQKGLLLEYEDRNIVDTSTLRNAISLTMIATALIFTIAIINIIHLVLYWLLERNREMGIMKALGATNGYLAKAVLFEILMVSFIGCLLAIVVQYIGMLFFSGTSIGKEVTFTVTWINLLAAMGVSLFFGMISAIVPMMKVMRLDPVSAINRT